MATNAQRRVQKPATEGEQKLAGAVAATLKEEGDALSPEDQAALGETAEDTESGAAPGEDEEVGSGDDGFSSVVAGEEPPAWAQVPGKLKVPAGKLIYYMRIPAEWTDKPGEGDRQCIMWNLTVADEDFALKRARGDQTRANRELAMAMIRAVDGHVADWTLKPGPGDVRNWFNAIGPRGRLLMQNVYLRTHTVDEEMRQRFFVDCFAFTTST